MSCNVQFNWGLKIIFVQKFFMKATCFIKFLMLGLYILSTAVPLKAQNSPDLFFDFADLFFETYVVDGKVDYATLSNNPRDLFLLIQQMNKLTFESLDQDTQKALLINAYNLHAIRSIVDHWPVGSPQSIQGFFDRRKHITAGMSTTLDELEKKELFGRFSDARLHLVLVCAAMGCPPLANYAFRPEQLDDQLDQQVRNALADHQFIRIDRPGQKIALSQIFQWYRQDFTRSHDNIRSFINTYLDEPISEGFKISYYPYDWTVNAVSQPDLSSSNGGSRSNIQVFTPSVLLGKNQLEVKWFNNLYTQTSFRNNEREKVSLGQRENFYTSILQVNYGISEQGRFNVGFEANYQAVRLDRDPESSPLRVLEEGGENTIFQKSRLTYLGPRVRVAPIPSVPKFSITSTLQIPLSNDLELVVDSVQRFLAHNRVNWWTQFFYDKSFGDFQLFTEVDLLFRFPTDEVSFRQDAFFLTPLIVFFSYFPNSKTTFNVNLQYWPTFTGLPGNSRGESFGLSGDFVQTGLGAKYQLTPDINLEVIYTNFITSRNEGAGQTFNFGIVFIR